MSLQIIGKTVKFFHKNQWNVGTIAKCNPTKAKVNVEGRIWNVPYNMLYETSEQVNPLSLVQNKRETYNFSFVKGDSVSFGRPNGKRHYGTIMKVNTKTFLVNTNEGIEYRVPGSLLTKED